MNSLDFYLAQLCGCKRDVARVAGKVGGLTDCVITGLCGALPEAKGKGGGAQGAYSKANSGMGKVVIFLVVASLLMIAPDLMIFAQQSDRMTVSGKVTCARYNDEVPGVTVLIKNTVRGTHTDENGNYTINDIRRGQTLEFTCLGYHSQEIVVDSAIIDVVLNPVGYVVIDHTQENKSVFSRISLKRIGRKIFNNTTDNYDENRFMIDDYQIDPVKRVIYCQRHVTFSYEDGSHAHGFRYARCRDVRFNRTFLINFGNRLTFKEFLPIRQKAGISSLRVIHKTLATGYHTLILSPARKIAYMVSENPYQSVEQIDVRDYVHVRQNIFKNKENQKLYFIPMGNTYLYEITISVDEASLQHSHGNYYTDKDGLYLLSARGVQQQVETVNELDHFFDEIGLIINNLIDNKFYYPSLKIPFTGGLYSYYNLMETTNGFYAVRSRASNPDTIKLDNIMIFNVEIDDYEPIEIEHFRRLTRQFHVYKNQLYSQNNPIETDLDINNLHTIRLNGAATEFITDGVFLLGGYNLWLFEDVDIQKGEQTWYKFEEPLFSDVDWKSLQVVSEKLMIDNNYIYQIDMGMLKVTSIKSLRLGVKIIPSILVIEDKSNKFLNMTAFAQQSDRMTVSGKVTCADDGEILLGVSVAVKGTTRKTVTDIYGLFSISVERGETLVFSLICYETQEIIAHTDTVNITLKTNDNYMPFSINEIEFFPKEFHNVRLGYREGRQVATSPNSRSLWNEIVINVPSKIIYTIHDKFTFTPVIPVCSADVIGRSRGLRYANSSAKMLYIRKVGDSIWYSGEIVRPQNNDIVLCDGTILTVLPHDTGLPPGHVERERVRQQRILEAQNYTDEEFERIEREEVDASGGYMNLNLMEYVELPIETGVYEIYMSFFGLQSNRAIVEIIFIEEQKVLPLPYE